jgi:hypothetical protein
MKTDKDMNKKATTVAQAEPRTPYSGIKIIFKAIFVKAPMALKTGIQVVISFAYTPGN